MVYKFFDKKTTSGMNVNEAQELHKPLIKQIKGKKVYSRFKDSIWAADLAEKGSLASFNCGVKYLLCVIDIFTKYAFVKLCQIKKAKTVLDGLIRIVNESKCIPNKLWADQGKEFSNKPMEKWLLGNNFLMYLTYNKNKSVVAERFTRTLKSKVYKNEGT